MVSSNLIFYSFKSGFNFFRKISENFGKSSENMFLRFSGEKIISQVLLSYTHMTPSFFFFYSPASWSYRVADVFRIPGFANLMNMFFFLFKNIFFFWLWSKISPPLFGVGRKILYVGLSTRFFSARMGGVYFRSFPKLMKLIKICTKYRIWESKRMDWETFWSM